MADTNQNDVTKLASGENVCVSLGDETCGQTDRRNLFKLIYAAGCQPEMLLNFVNVRASRRQENACHFVFI